MRETLIDLKNRRSCRKYTEQQITEEELSTVLEAGTYAPTGHGTQSPVMVVVQDKETVALLSRLNAAVRGTSADPFYGAPTVIVVFSDSNVETYVEDGSLVIGNLMLGAYAVGLGSCWIHRAKEVFESEEGKKLMKKWGIPENYKGVGNCILGYAACELPTPKPRKADYILKV